MKQKSITPRITAVRAISATRRHVSLAANGSSQPNPCAPHIPSDSQRREELARLLPLWPKELADLSLAGRRRIIRSLERALRAERKRGRDGHWAYDLARHAALIAAWRSECASLRLFEHASLMRKASKQKGPPEGEPF